jgi:Tol biopolymer transport system component
LEEAGLQLGELDEVNPPLSSPLLPETAVVVVRVAESLEVVPESIPFERRVVRSDSLEPGDHPRVVQMGKPGLQEVTVRIVFRDGLEAERWPTNVTVVEPAQDEIVLISAGSSQESVTISGTLAFINSGRALVLRGSTATPMQLQTGTGLDGRVFTLSPDGQFLLYTRMMTETAQFQNSLWIVDTERDAAPRSLEVDNVLWAGWEPGNSTQPRIAFTTAAPSSQPPGWEANNDLWLGAVPLDANQLFTPQEVIENYPATYGWWGGNYAWSPAGRFLAYSYANEIGLIDLGVGVDSGGLSQQNLIVHRPVHQFTEYRTGSDWVWVPSLSWSPDGRYLTFSRHAGENPDADEFELAIVDLETQATTALRPQSGIWSHAFWSPVGSAAGQPIAFLQAGDPSDSQRSSYTLWLMDQDGSNARRIYPPENENSFFPRDATSLAWSPDGQAMAFIFHDALYILNFVEDKVFHLTQDESRNSHPTWVGVGDGFNASGE